MIYCFDFDIRVEYIDTDKMGVMHNSRYFLFFERGRTETMRHLGFGYKKIEGSGIMMPVIEQYARYISPAYYDEVLTVRTYINEMPTARIKFEYEIIRKEGTSQPIICSGHNSLAFVDIKSGKPLRCPKLIIEALSLSND